MMLHLILSEAATETPAASAPSVFPMIITLGLSVVLLFVLLVLFLTRKRISPMVYASRALSVELQAAEAFAAAPDKASFKRLYKAIRKAESRMLDVAYAGVVELDPVHELQKESLNICRSLEVVGADGKRRAGLAGVLLENARRSAELILPYASEMVDDDPLSLSRKSGAEAYLRSVESSRTGGDEKDD